MSQLSAEDLSAVQESVQEAAENAEQLRHWGTCTCGHWIYDHGRYKPANSDFVYGRCRHQDCDCSGWIASDGSNWPYDTAGIVKRELLR